MTEIIDRELKRSAKAISLIESSVLLQIAEVMIKTLRADNQIIFMGNGGSSADAEHLAAELSGRYMMDRPALSSIALSNVASLTAIGNDCSFENIFKRQIEANCKKGDCVVALSTSGNSKNILLGIEAAKGIGAKTISFTGAGGEAKDLVDIALKIPTIETPRVQEGYMVAGHVICGIIEREMFGPKVVFVDRDDTIAPDVPYCDDPKKFNIFSYVPEAIKRLNEAGYMVIIITNQSGIGRGHFDKDTLDRIHTKMISQVEAGGGRIDDLFYCPHRPDENCLCRKPEIGMGEQAVRKYGISLSRSFMIGDSDKDIEFGERLGCKAIQVGKEVTFSDAVDEILRS